jgi:tetratricopeptide (TPR) repeat protein
MRRKNLEGFLVFGQWFIGIAAYLFTSNLGGQIGVTLGVVIGVLVMIMPDAAWNIAGDFLFFSGALSLPSTILTLGSTGAVIGIVASFTARKGKPVTLWSKKTVARGKYHLETGDIDKAFALADKTLKFGAADFPGGYQLRGDACLEKGDKYKAVEEYTKAIRLKPDLADGYCDRCVAYMMVGDYNKAVADATEAIRLGSASKTSPASSRGAQSIGYLYRGKAYSLKGDHNKAIADLSEVLRNNPRYMYGYYCRGCAYKESGDVDKAIADFSEAIRREPLDGFFFGCRGDAYSANGDLDNAIADYTEAVRFGPNRAKWRFFRGIAHENKGDADSAVADFNAVIRMEPHSEEAASARDALKRLCPDKPPATGNPAYAQNPRERKSKTQKDLENFLRNGREYIES